MPLQVVLLLLLLSVLLLPLTIRMLLTVLLLLLVERLLPLPCPLLWLHAGLLHLLLRLQLIVHQLHDRLALLFPSRQRLSRGIHQHRSWHCWRERIWCCTGP